MSGHALWVPAAGRPAATHSSLAAARCAGRLLSSRAMGAAGIIGRYLALEFAMAAGGVLVVLATVYFTADCLLHLDDLGRMGLIALRDALLRSLDILPQGVPTACALGAAL